MILVGDVRESLARLESDSVQTCITSPPYFGLRDYGHEGQIGLEQTPEDYVEALITVFREVRRVLKNDGTVWLNLGDSYYNYRPGKGQALVQQSVANNLQDLPQKCARRGNKLAGLKDKDLIGIPWMVAFALRADGWYLRQDIIWNKPNVMPESVRDRCTKSHEYIFLLTKSPSYYFDYESIREPLAEATKERIKHSWKCSTPAVKNKEGIDVAQMGDRLGFRNGRRKRSVWTVPPRPFKGAHFATYPPQLIEPCVLAGSRAGDVVLDPFGGSGTTGLVARQHGRRFIMCELNPEYAAIMYDRIYGDVK